MCDDEYKIEVDIIDEEWILRKLFCSYQQGDTDTLYITHRLHNLYKISGDNQILSGGGREKWVREEKIGQGKYSCVYPIGK